MVPIGSKLDMLENTGRVKDNYHSRETVFRTSATGLACDVTSEDGVDAVEVAGFAGAHRAYQQDVYMVYLKAGKRCVCVNIRLEFLLKFKAIKSVNE